MTGTQLDFGVLGPLQVTADGVPLPLGTPKQRAVLAVLVINRNRPVSMDTLIDACWEEEPPSGARASVHSYVSNLRKLLTKAGGNQVLVSAAPGYQLRVTDADCDLGRFTAERTAGVHAGAAGRFAQAGTHLTAALAQWRGPVLEDLRGFAFADTFATALAEDRLTAVTARAEAEIVCGRAAAVIGELESLAAEHPFREPLWAQLITAYYLSERQSDALAAYQRLKTTLADELGIDPGPALRALHERILRQEPLDAKGAAKTSAVGSVTVLDQRTSIGGGDTAASLVEDSGRRWPLEAVATRIGRLPDNDIVLDDAKVSRHHAAIIDTGASFVISDLRSANGVQVGDVRVRGSASLSHGDQIRICDFRFTFELGS